ncbi:MAG TPA: Gfo/Idh/MocA family oxidoreductase [Pirellulales bacterium]|nr:Gfo/Idh/MocA family oxidoreductase [Pirellulales bacterium]
MADRIQVGVITQENGPHLSAYLEALRDCDEAAGVALADASGANEEAAKTALGGKLSGVYRDTGAMLKAARPALTLVTMEAALAPPQIEAALDAGSHVLAEKPSCVRAADFAALVHKAQSKHLQIMLAFANRLHAPVQEAKRLAAAGKLGRLYGVEMHLVADQTRLQSPAYHRTWFAHKDRAGGGNLIWLGIHWIDMAQYILGSNISEVAGFSENVGGQPIDVEDAASFALKFDGGGVGTLISGYFLDRGYHSHLQIWGERGWLRVAATEEQPLEWYSRQGTEPPKIERFEYPKGERGYTPFVQACVRFAAGKQPPPVTSEESLHVLKTVFACYDAAKTGQTQRVT